MDRYLNRRTALALVTGLIVVPAGFQSRAFADVAATPAAEPSPVASLDAIVAAGVAQGLPGANVLVDIDGGQSYTASAGVASLERGTPLTLEDRFRIYSITKTFTAIVTLQLVDDGLITLDDTVRRWLDDAEVVAIPDIDSISIRQLLMHTSGIYDYFDDASPFLQDALIGEGADWSRVWTPQELLAYADGSKADPYFRPGMGQHYSNTNYILLGLIIEKATGNAFSQELQTRILTPLDLSATKFDGDDPVVVATVDGYQLLEGERVNVTSTNVSWAWTAGGMTSSINDLARFADAVFAGTLLKPQSFKGMVAFGPATGDIAEGMGVFTVDTPFGQVIGMDGESAGFSAVMFRLPESGITIVALTNLAPGGAVFENMKVQLIEWAVARAS